ncbi:MAG: hypothetical protein AAF310_01115 [Myxococcota bacterium]
MLHYLQPYLPIEEGRDVTDRILGMPLEKLQQAGLDRSLGVCSPAPSQQEATSSVRVNRGR